MEISRHQDELEAIIPGVFRAYDSLRTKNGMGMYTSNGAFYNHTFFGRDTAMAAKFVTDFDHQVARETIVALAALQAAKDDPLTQEELGRIHHEYRDFSTWKSDKAERIALSFFKKRWGSSSDKLLTYYASDTTALFIRLVYKYVNHVDRSILETTMKNRHGDKRPLREAVAQASDWLVSQLNDKSQFMTKRPNDWALPYQTFMDSSTAFPRTDGSLANFRQGIAYTEVQAFSIDALEEATSLLNEHDNRHTWQNAAHSMRRSLVNDFWSESEQFFGSAIDSSGLIAMPTVTAGWTLNTSLWDELPEKKRIAMISSIVTRLFSDDFLTPYGLRTRSLNADQPLPSLIEYHGRLTIWPMFNFMVIEGLRRHRLHGLAEELENRLINGINVSGEFEEFLVVDAGNHLLRPASRRDSEVAVDSQMLPEKHIAFTVIPAMALAWRATNRGRAWPAPNDWQKRIDQTLLGTLDRTSRLTPSDAHQSAAVVVPTSFRRFRGNVRSAWFFYNQRRRM